MNPAEKHLRGIALSQQGKLEEACKLLAEALGEEESSERWCDWGAVQYALGAHDDAETAFQLALEMEPANTQAALNLGALLFASSRFRESITVLEPVLSQCNPQERAAAEQMLRESRAKAPSYLGKEEEIEQYLRSFVSDDPNGQSYFQTHLQRYLDTLLLLPQGTSGQRILELGAAFHHVTSALVNRLGYGEVRCTDIWKGEPRETRCVRSNTGSEEFSVVVDNFDVQSRPWPYEDASFDGVLCCEMLEHLFADPVGLFSEINRVLKQDGFLLLTTPNLACGHAVESLLKGESPYVYGKFEKEGRATDRHNREYTPEEVERLARAAGFEIIVFRTRDSWWPRRREVLRTLAAQGHPIGRRGDNTFLLARKKTGVLDRYPEEFYLSLGTQGERRSKQDGDFEAKQELGPALVKPRTILVIHELLPHFDCSGSDLRLMDVLRELRVQGHAITFLARDGKDAAQYIPPLQELNIKVIPGDPARFHHAGVEERTSWEFRDVLAKGKFDIAILCHWFWGGISIPEQYLEEIREFSPSTRIAILTDDRHGERERRLAGLSKLLSDFERGNDFEQREAEVYRRADLVLYITEADRKRFLELVPGLATEYLPMIAQQAAPGPGFQERKGVLFLGNFENPANNDALEWFLSKVWPLARKSEPRLKLYVAGHAAPRGVETKYPGVVCLGKVAELGPLFAAHRVFAAPIRFGTGINTKNVMALAHGLPVVTTSIGAEGMQLAHGSHGLVADSSKEFAAAILRLNREETLWTSLSTSGREFIQSAFSPERLRSQIRTIVSRAVALSPRPVEDRHTWSYRAVEETHPEVLTQRPPNYRYMLRTLAYWQMGRRHLAAGRPAAALEQFRHIFTTVRGPLLATIFHSTLLNDMARCYRELGDTSSAARCEKELRQPAIPWKTPVPPESRGTGKKLPEKKPPEISIVIPTYNRGETLRLCLSALAFQSLPADRWEVVVVDDGSTGETEAVCRDILLPYSSLRYFRQENQGAGAARQKGVEMARGEFVLLINDDTIPGSNLLVEHLSVHRRNPHEKWAVLGEFSPSQESIHRALSLWVNTSPFFFPQQNLKPGELCDQAYFITCNLSIRRDAVLEAGSFDPQFRVAEDTDLGTRLVQRGFKVKFHPEAGAVHEHGHFTLSDLLRRAHNYGVADWRLFEKHPQLLGDGSGPFGRLHKTDFLRIEAYLNEKRSAVEAALAALEALEDVDMIPLCQKDAQGNTVAEGIIAQLAQVVPLVYWYHLFDSFLRVWKEVRQRDATAALPEEMAAQTR
jgi:GT2 family glycosyltransferase/SAM-dependent methyltransferase/glycosyltransferase involved in cell wall biosynthesis